MDYQLSCVFCSLFLLRVVSLCILWRNLKFLVIFVSVVILFLKLYVRPDLYSVLYARMGKKEEGKGMDGVAKSSSVSNAGWVIELRCGPAVLRLSPRRVCSSPSLRLPPCWPVQSCTRTAAVQAVVLGRRGREVAQCWMLCSRSRWTSSARLRPTGCEGKKGRREVKWTAHMIRS